jgi:hypothetical protein
MYMASVGSSDDESEGELTIFDMLRELSEMLVQATPAASSASANARASRPPHRMAPDFSRNAGLVKRAAWHAAAMPAPIPTRIVASARPLRLAPAQVLREFHARLAGGATLCPAGEARREPARLLRTGYAPSYAIPLFDTTFYLSAPRENEDIRFFVAYVTNARGAPPAPIHPRIFYKDVSLVWRSATHFVRSEHENWIGKGDVRTVVEDGHEITYSAESTTDLPIEIQTALETVLRRAGRIAHDERAVALVLRRGPDDRIRAYRDFTEPRRIDQADRRNLVNGGRPVARFTRRHDPASLRFAPGFEPDFARGVMEVARSVSTLYGGRLRRFRILSRNRRIQYLFMAAPRQVWIVPPQATTTQLSSYGVRTVDVVVDEDLCVPGYEYHHGDGDSQIPPGFAGPPSPRDPSRADASPWLDRLPVIQAFRREVLGARR